MFVVTTVNRSVPMAREADSWRWVVAIAAFLTQFIVCGITYSLGVFHVVFRDTFYESHFETSWVGSILLYVTALSSKALALSNTHTHTHTLNLFLVV